jgi:hypothetical protein
MKHGKFNDKQTIVEHNNLYAARYIAKDELLLQVPWNAILQDAQDESGDSFFNCGLVHRLAHELERGNGSGDYAPYMLYLSQKQLIPSGFSDFGRELMLDLLGDDEDLPPPEPIGWMDEWVSDCQGDPTDDFARMAAMLFLQQQYDDMMVPVYDFYKHRNGPYTNTYVSIDHKYGLQVYASRDIQQGEQLHQTYNQCKECGDDFENYGTAGTYGHIANDNVELYRFFHEFIHYSILLALILQKSFEIADWSKPCRKNGVWKQRKWPLNWWRMSPGKSR